MAGLDQSMQSRDRFTIPSNILDTANSHAPTIGLSSCPIPHSIANIIKIIALSMISTHILYARIILMDLIINFATILNVFPYLHCCTVAGS